MNFTRCNTIKGAFFTLLMVLMCVPGVYGQTPVIEANGSGDSVTLDPGESLSVRISLDPGNQADKNADWWIAASTPSNDWIHLDLSEGGLNWEDGLSVTYQGPLTEVPLVEVFNMSELSEGDHVFYFGVIVQANDGGATGDSFFYDSVNVTVNAAAAEKSYPVVDTGQTSCYSSTALMTCPSPGDDFYGQDAQHDGLQPSYTLGSDGNTVHDNVTGLTWTKSPDLNGDGEIDVNDKLTFDEAKSYPATLNAQNYGGYGDWRLPTIKELYSLMDFRGTDPSGPGVSGLTPFIDVDYFDFGYGDESAGERNIDAQFWSSSAYVGTVFINQSAAFGLNLADGRIKGYPTDERMGKTNYVYFVRGATSYGINDFTDNGDGTVTDGATGLMWAQDDSGTGMNWLDSLAWVRQKNSQNHLGHGDWRLPDAKEMQSIVDYSRAPGATGSAAIDPVFDITGITNEDGQADYPWFWTGTTHVRVNGSGSLGVYICFGRAMGYMNGSWLDVHGAGAQRSDQKGGDFSQYFYAPDGYYFGGGSQGDATRIYNFVRLVRDAE